MPADKPTVIKKYANRRLYHTGTSTYVTLDDLAEMVRRGEDFVVQDARTGENITRAVLGQIIFDAESRGEGLLPIAFLRQLITFYGGHMQALVPTYLEHALASFARDQDKLRKQVNEAWGSQAFDVVEDQVRRNMDMFQRSMRMFMPFTPDTDSASQSPENLAQDVAALRQELARMQERIDALAPDGESAEDDRAPDDGAPDDGAPDNGAHGDETTPSTGASGR
jgi:polyhydroxyalkanoate synthesis repressor PhaR